MSGGHKGLFIGKGYVVPRLYRFYCRYYPEHSHDRRHHYISFGNNCGSHKPLHSETYFIFKIGGKKLKLRGGAFLCNTNKLWLKLSYLFRQSVYIAAGGERDDFNVIIISNYIQGLGPDRARRA